jgi:hypothetical protein
MPGSANPFDSESIPDLDPKHRNLDFIRQLWILNFITIDEYLYFNFILRKLSMTFCHLSGRYDNPMPESAISPQSVTKNLGLRPGSIVYKYTDTGLSLQTNDKIGNIWISNAAFLLKNLNPE